MWYYIFLTEHKKVSDFAGKKRKFPTTEVVLRPLHPRSDRDAPGNGKVHSYILFLELHWKH